MKKRTWHKWLITQFFINSVLKDILGSVNIKKKWLQTKFHTTWFCFIWIVFRKFLDQFKVNTITQFIIGVFVLGFGRANQKKITIQTLISLTEKFFNWQIT